MPRPVDLTRIRREAIEDLTRALAHYDSLLGKDAPYFQLRWVAEMTCVKVHRVWERFAESRLVAALNHAPSHFLVQNAVRGVTRIPVGLARHIVRAGQKYFDFRSTSELCRRADALVGKGVNPFRTISSCDAEYLDALAAIRNVVVHGSDAAEASYRRHLGSVYSIRSVPEPDEFLHAIDRRVASPARGKSRLHGLATVVERTIRTS